MKLLEVLSGLLTPIIAILASYIAYRQYRTAKAKLKLDLYEKRLKIFKYFKTFIWQRITNLEFVINEHENELRDFEINTTESMFLFGDEIVKFRNDLIINGKNLIKKEREIKRRIDEDNLHFTDPMALKELQIESHEISTWFETEHKNIENRFRKYLDFRKL